MPTFLKENGDIVILHGHSFCVCDFLHKFSLVYIFDHKIREEKDIEDQEKDWEKYIKNLGTLQKRPLEKEV